MSITAATTIELNESLGFCMNASSVNQSYPKFFLKTERRVKTHSSRKKICFLSSTKSISF